MEEPSCKVSELAEDQSDLAVGLLARFFTEEGFAGTPATIWANTRRMLADPIIGPASPGSMALRSAW